MIFVKKEQKELIKIEQVIQKLKEFRTKNNKTQEEFGKVIGTTKQQYQLYESGKREIKVIHIKRICEHYNISPEYILGYIDEQKELPRSGK